MSLQAPGFSDPTIHTAGIAAQFSLASGLQDQIKQYTEGLFGSPVEILAELDPETDDKYFAVYAATGEESATIARLNDTWHRWLLGTSGKAAGFYRLALSIR
jgi:hypothetical protein